MHIRIRRPLLALVCAAIVTAPAVAGAQGEPPAQPAAAEEPPGAPQSEGEPNRPPPQGKAVIWGVIRDSATGEPIVDTAVDVVGTGHGAAADAEGRFRLVLAPGKYTLRFWSDAHHAIRATGVVVWAGAVRQIDVALERADGAIEEFVVEAPTPASGMDAVTLERKKATSVGDAVSRSEISKSADRDAAQAAR
jgi:hypothetical protein